MGRRLHLPDSLPQGGVFDAPSIECLVIFLPSQPGPSSGHTTGKAVIPAVRVKRLDDIVIP
jgi:hypothetical protein